MIDEPRDDELADDEGTDQAGDAPEAPRPQTWAGRTRAEADEPADEAAATPEPAGDEAHEEADEREEPPDEFEFSEDEADEDEDEAEPDDEDHTEAAGSEEAEAGVEGEAEDAEEPDAEGEAEDKPEAGEKPGQETVEVDTLAISDREAEQEAAHAGLKARAEKTAAHRVATSGAQAAVAGAVASLPEEGAGEPPRRNVWWRFLAASFVVVASTAAATAIAFLLYLTDIGSDLKGDETFANAVDQNLSDVEGGDPQTILILGSDKRTTEPGDPGRSDTTMLLRVDPEKEFLSLLSLPRDLMVEIPGYGGPYKLNEAYSIGEQQQAQDKEGGGGPDLTLKTVKNLLGIDINHIVNVDFEGFYDAINAIGCVYVDVDRHYFNPVGGEYDDIDIQAGYTKLCGYTGLDYVRYRHNDNDLVRGARQQAFVREARQQIPPRSLLPPPFGDAELIDIFTEYTTSDIDTAPDIVEMLKAFVDVRNAPVRQVSLGELTVDGGVGTSSGDVKAAVNQFLGNDLDDAPEEPVEAAESTQEKKPKDKSEAEPEAPAMVDVTATAQEYAGQFQNWLRRRKAGLPVFYPTAVVENINAGISEESRAHQIQPPEGNKPYYGFKWVLPFQESFGTSYYGVAGVNWLDPPILNNPSEVRRVDGRDYLVFYEKDRVRMLAWTTDDGAYWVSNTLTRALSEDQMFAVATSVREFEG